MITTHCTSCGETIHINRDSQMVGLGSANHPKEGPRADAAYDGVLYIWDCPNCDYPDSFDTSN